MVEPPSHESMHPGRLVSLVRRLYALLIAAAISVVLARAFAPAALDPASALDVVGLIPALAGGAAVCAALTAVSASHAGLASIAHLRLPGLGPGPRAVANGLTWAALALLAVHFTAAAFEPLPGGPRTIGCLLGAAFGVGTYRLHRHALDHEAYRTFNLVAMLLAAGSLASMSITPTGDWWAHNFSTLGTSNDLAAVCFNVAVVVSGAGMAGLSGALTRALAFGAFAIRRGARTTMRVLIGLVGFGLMGVGTVPIDRQAELHNAFALGAALAFALLCVGARWYARRLPRRLLVFSYAALALELVAMAGYDALGWFSLTVFEIIAFALVFAWLIALVATTSGHHHGHGRSLSAHAGAESSDGRSVGFGRELSRDGSRKPIRRKDGHRIRPVPRPRPSRVGAVRAPPRAAAHADGSLPRRRPLRAHRRPAGHRPRLRRHRRGRPIAHDPG
ncbi:DUF998 domain-containing protein [Agromyces italicus]|uniref:DUF998 domain-containing protein n=1 Tax=Agromyces italicus TaxID=279572 RepID=UPI0003B3033E|nr:DUF998 domain-containing protein [Agromyces italicus]